MDFRLIAFPPSILEWRQEKSKAKLAFWREPPRRLPILPKGAGRPTMAENGEHRSLFRFARPMPTELVSSAETAVDSAEFDYRPLSGWAVLGLLLGLASALAWVAPLLWIVPVLAAAICSLALADIRRASPPRSGRRLALAGLAAACFFAAAAVGQYVSRAMLLRQQAQAVCDEWFAALLHGQPQYAHQWELRPGARADGPLDEATLRTFYAEQPEARDGLRQLVGDKLVRTLLELGTSAQVRYYEMLDYSGDSRVDTVGLVYAVTFQQDGVRTTFYCRLYCQRDLEYTGLNSPWHVASRVGGVRPGSQGG